MIQLIVLLKIFNEKAHDGCLLRHSEALNAIVDTDEHKFALSREVKLQAHIVPLLDLFIAFLPVIGLNENRRLVCDHKDLTVAVWLWHLRVANFQCPLTRQQFFELDPLGHPIWANFDSLL